MNEGVKVTVCVLLVLSFDLLIYVMVRETIEKEQKWRGVETRAV